MSLALPFALLQIYDRILPNQSYGTATVLAIGVAFAIILEAILRYLRSWLLASSAANFEQSTVENTVHSLFKADYKYIAKMGIGRIYNGFTAISHMRDAYSGQLMIALVDFPFAIIFLGLIAYIGGHLVFIPIVVWICVGLVVLYIGRQLKKVTHGLSLSESKRSRLYIRVFSGLTIEKALAQESSTSSDYRKSNYQYANTQQHADWLAAKLQLFIGLASQGTTIVLIMVGSFAVLSGDLTTGGLTACSILAGRAVAPLSSLIGLYNRLAITDVAKSEVKELLALPEVPFRGEVSLPEEQCFPAGPIRFNDFICEEMWVKLNIHSLEIKAYEMVSVHSEPFCFANLFVASLAGLKQKKEGSLIIGEHELYEYHYEDYREAVIFVPSWPTLFAGSILDNLTMFQPELENEVVIIADQLGLSETIGDLSAGYQTEIAESGIETFSKGTIKLIAMVRALVQKPSILLLDQPMLSLDIDSQQRLIDLLHKQRDKMTIVVNSYFQNMIDACDCHISFDMNGISTLARKGENRDDS